MADPWVKEVQEWLNDTYSGFSGWGSVPEDGKTGWTTIYGLIRGVQHELGIRAYADNFGTTTQQKWDQQVPSILFEGKKSNIIKLMEGAMRCKGVGTGSFKDTFDVYTDYGMKQLKSQAGFENPDATFSSMWAKALFDMSAFTLVQPGTSETRQIQQTLNRKYYKWTGILPCDGIYQRATNTALIYGIQVEIGIGDIANGYFGDGTRANYLKCYNQGLENYPNLVLLIQFALYQNVQNIFYGTVPFTGNLDSDTKSIISEFQNFMQLKEVQSGMPDLRTLLSMLQSNGDTSRAASGCDTAQQLTATQILTLKQNGYDIVGRYLTGTAGGEFIPKGLTREECLLLFENDINIFPIFQDNIYIPKPSLFSEPRGVGDARKAISAARGLGIPEGQIIYFAVDCDCQGWEISEYIIPYFTGIMKAMYDSGYHYGIYGTRNVCTTVEKAMSNEILSLKSIFVSNMSSGFSGNLGFPQPENWAFDQFYEPSGGIGSGVGNVLIDKVAVSGKNTGFSQLTNGLSMLDSFADLLGYKSLIGEEIRAGQEYQFSLWTLPADIDVTISFMNELSVPGESSLVLEVENGVLSPKAKLELDNYIDGIENTSYVENAIDGFVSGIRYGDVSFEVELKSDRSYSIKVIVNSKEFDYNGVSYTVSAEIEIEVHARFFDIDGIDEVVDEAMKNVPVIAASLVLGLLLGALIVGSGGTIIAAGATEAIKQIIAFLGMLALPTRKK